MIAVNAIVTSLLKLATVMASMHQANTLSIDPAANVKVPTFVCDNPFSYNILANIGKAVIDIADPENKITSGKSIFSEKKLTSLYMKHYNIPPRRKGVKIPAKDISTAL